MVSRQGLTTGTGKGYRNVICKDPMVHSMSAKGMKQPQVCKPIVSHAFIRKPIKQTINNRALKADLPIIIQTQQQLRENGGNIIIQKDGDFLLVGNFPYQYKNMKDLDKDYNYLTKEVLK